MTIASFDLYGIMLADGYSLSDWLNDRSEDRDLRVFLRRISAKVAYDSDVSDAVKDRFEVSEFQVEEREAPGLGLSYLLGTAAVSLSSERYWMRVRVPLRHIWLAEDGTLPERERRGVEHRPPVLCE